MPLLALPHDIPRPFRQFAGNLRPCRVWSPGTIQQRRQAAEDPRSTGRTHFTNCRSRPMQTGDFATKCEMADETAFASGFDRFRTRCPTYNGLEKYDSMDCATKPPGSKSRDSSR